MTVKQALYDKRRELRNKVSALTLCKRELFYHLKPDGRPGGRPGDSVYPVSAGAAAEEAAHFKVEWSEQ